jgi:osmoprotectant transport system ATP-binding protein
MELRLEGVTKRYDGTASAAVVDLDLTFPSGKTTALLGPSGCGKSTVLRLLIALVRPESGAVLVDGRPPTARDIEALRRRIGYVIQDGGLFPHLTAAENVTLMARYLRWDAARVTRRLDELQALTRFPAEGMGRYPTELSGGQAQRVAIMRALFLDPEVLLLDEPLGALDPLVRAELRDDLRAIFRSLGKTVVVVTHDVGEAAHLADIVVLMRDGRVVQQGPFSALVSAPADPFVTAFLSTGPATGPAATGPATGPAATGPATGSAATEPTGPPAPSPASTGRPPERAP